MTHAARLVRTTLALIFLGIFCFAGNICLSQSTSDLPTSQVEIADQKMNVRVEMALAAPANRGDNHATVSAPLRMFSALGIEGHVGLGGVGFNAATPLTRHLSLRAGADFFSYSTNFSDQGARIQASLRMRSGHGALDWFPKGNRLRLSPMIVFANNNRVFASYLVPAGNTITLNGQEYVSSLSDPLHGTGSVNFRKTSPGFTVGFGNVNRREKHFSTQLDAGFYYVGQPSLKVGFSGSACYPGLSESIACIPASSDPVFQQDLHEFILRNQHNLSYASVFPVINLGVGYAF